MVAVDDDGLLDAPEDARLLDRIEAIGAQSRARFGLIVAGRGPSTAADPWGLAIRLDRLTRGEASAYLAGKLAAAGRQAPAFSDRAVARLHAVAGGLPGALDRLAGLAMRAGAVERRAMIEAEVVEGVARECLGGRRANRSNRRTDRARVAPILRTRPRHGPNRSPMDRPTTDSTSR